MGVMDGMSPANSRLDRAAVVVSHLLNPAMVAWWVFAGLAWLAGAGWVAATVGVVFFALVPGLVLLYLSWAGVVDEVYPSDRSQRQRPLLLGVACYALGLVALGLAGAPGFMLGAGCVYCGNTLLVWQINKYWKISIHAVGVSGGLLILLLVGGSAWWPLLGALPLVAWARLQLKAHTPAQVAAGALLGVCSSALLFTLWTGVWA